MNVLCNQMCGLAQNDAIIKRTHVYFGFSREICTAGIEPGQRPTLTLASGGPAARAFAAVAVASSGAGREGVGPAGLLHERVRGTVHMAGWIEPRNSNGGVGLQCPGEPSRSWHALHDLPRFVCARRFALLLRYQRLRCRSALS